MSAPKIQLWGHAELFSGAAQRKRGGTVGAPVQSSFSGAAGSGTVALGGFTARSELARTAARSGDVILAALRKPRRTFRKMLPGFPPRRLPGLCRALRPDLFTR